MLSTIKTIAEEVGISLVYTNSDEKIESQLNRITKESDSPIMLISWDINTTITFDSNGFITNPSSQITAFLVAKPDDLTKDTAMLVAENMGTLFIKFIQELYNSLNVTIKASSEPLTNVNYQLVPRYGMGKHSGVLCKWTQKNDVEIVCK